MPDRRAGRRAGVGRRVGRNAPFNLRGLEFDRAATSTEAEPGPSEPVVDDEPTSEPANLGNAKEGCACSINRPAHLLWSRR